MAITIQAPQSPLAWLPAGNALTYTINSDQTAQPDFYYLVDVQINNTSVIKLRRFPVSGSSIMVDVREIIDAYITATFENATPGIRNFSTDILGVKVVATEYYSGQAYNSATASIIEIWNAAAQFEDEQQQAGYYLKNWYNNFRKYTQGGTTYFARPMGYHNIAAPSDIYVDSGHLQISREALENAYPMHRAFSRTASIFANVTANSSPWIVYLGCDETGKVLKKMYTPFDSVTNYTNALIYSNIGGKLVGSNFTYAEDLDGNPAADMDDCAYIVFYYADFVDVVTNEDKPISTPIVMKMGDCPETFAVLYRSFEGGWNMIQCNNRAVETTSIETTTRENIRPNIWAQDTRLISSVNVHAQGRWSLNTDWISKAIGEEVKDMLQSPTLFIMHYESGSVKYIPVTLINADYVTEQHKDVNLFNYRFEFAEAFYKNTIRH